MARKATRQARASESTRTAAARRPPTAPPPAALVPAERDRLRTAAALLGLAALIGLTYANSLTAGFARDSAAIILGAPQVHGASWENVKQILTRDYWWPMTVTGTYRPIATLSYWLEFAVLGQGDRPAGYHWVNLVLCWSNAALVYALARRGLGLALRPSFLLAALFALHPVGPEVVTNIVGRADLLAAAAVLGGLLLHVLALGATGTRRALWLAALAVTLLLGCFAKENAIALVGAIVVYDLVFVAGLVGGEKSAAVGTDAAAGGELSRQRAIGRLALRDWPVLVPPLAIAWAVRSWVAARAGQAPLAPHLGENAIFGLGFVAGRLSALKVLARSLWVLSWPRTLCSDYSVGEITPWGQGGGDDWHALAGAAALLAGVGLAIAAARRGWRDCRAALFFAGFFVVTWLPTSNLVIPIASPLAERFLYLPALGFLGGLVLAVEALGRAVGRLAPAAPPSGAAAAPAVSWTILGAIALAYAWRSHERNLDWQSDLALFSRAVETCAASFQSHKGLALALVAADASGADEQVLERAIAEAEAAQAILERHAPPGTPVPAVVLQDLGGFRLRQAELRDRRGAPEAAVQAARTAADALDRAAAWYRSLDDEQSAAIRAAGGRPDEAVEIGIASLEEDRGRAYLRLGEPAKARAAFLHQSRLAVATSAPWLNLADADRALGRNDDALVETLQAMIVEPGRADLGGRLIELYRAVEPGGCAVVEREDGYAIDPACPAAKRLACRAYDGLAQAILQGRGAPLAQRRQAAEQLSAVGAETFGCAGATAPGTGADP